MEDDSSNDVVAMETEDSYVPHYLADKPLMLFFQRLLLNNVSQNTILTNAQIEDILTRDFNFTLSELHPLEVDIYVTVMKKYLKEWPLWDEVETSTKDLKSREYDANFVSLMHERYLGLKKFLQEKLNMAKNLSSELMSKVRKNKSEPPVEDPTKDTPSKVVLEINATRAQLNKLIYRQPHPKHNNTIFNINDNVGPSHIIVNTLNLESILNWWSVKITISLQANKVFLTRQTTHELKHLLVNRNMKNQQSCPVVSLNQNLHIKQSKTTKGVSKKLIVECLDLLSTDHDVAMEGMDTVINFVKKDLQLFDQAIGAPAHYKRYLNQYAYVRYLYTDVENVERAKYDIQLRETVSPMHEFYVGHTDITLSKTLPQQWLKVECVPCSIAFSGKNLASELKQHFDQYHLDEREWVCSNCRMTFPMTLLAMNWWSHNCI